MTSCWSVCSALALIASAAGEANNSGSPVMAARRELVLMDGKYFASHFDIIFKILGQLILLEWIRKRATKLLELFILCMSVSVCSGIWRAGFCSFSLTRK